MKDKNYNLGVLFLLGALSGIVSFFSVRFTYWGAIFLPGLVFGAIVGFYFFKRLGLQYFWFAVASMLSYCWAVLVVLSFTYGWGVLSNPTDTIIYSAYIHSPLAIFAGGLLGTLFLLFAFRQFIFSPSRDAFLLLLMLGSTLSITFFVGYLVDYTFPSQNLRLPINQLLSLFILWQAVMASALGWAGSTTVMKKKLFVPLIVMVCVMVVTLLCSTMMMDIKTKKDRISTPAASLR
jgi:hypothetical protein